MNTTIEKMEARPSVGIAALEIDLAAMALKRGASKNVIEITYQHLKNAIANLKPEPITTIEQLKEVAERHRTDTMWCSADCRTLAYSIRSTPTNCEFTVSSPIGRGEGATLEEAEAAYIESTTPESIASRIAKIRAEADALELSAKGHHV